MAEDTTFEPEAIQETVAGDSRGKRKRSGLGRGLGALIPELSHSIPESAIDTIDVSSVQPNPYQPRSAIDDDAFLELVSSIKLHGILQPIIVNFDPDSGEYILIAGERRWRAAQQAGLQTIPAVIKDATPQQMLEFAIVENVVRSDLSPLEEAVAYRQLIHEFGLTQLEVAERVGRSRVSVANTMRLLFSPDAVKTALTGGEITEGHARALLALESPADQVAMLEKVIVSGLSVRQTEAAVRAWLARATRLTSERASRLSADSTIDLASDRLQRFLSTRVTAKAAESGKGSLNIHFDSLEHLEDIVSRIAGEEIY
ncbi:MAG: ParB/RepB/Spo0J family partition protein [Thermomicrobiales bacterium]